MKKFLILLCAGLTSVSLAADRSGRMLRGGFGFLFPDHNRFSNAGQLALDYGLSIEAGYGYASGSQTATPSVVFGNGKIAVGAYGSRTGTNLATANDTAGALLGVTVMKNLTFGVSYAAALTSLSSGTAGATLTFNGAQRKGPSIGVGFQSTLGATNVMGATVGLGYSFKPNTSLEANFVVPNISSLSAYQAVVAGTYGSEYCYVGAAGSYASGAISAAARLGFILGKYFDLSGIVNYAFSGGALSYGATVRATF